MLIPTAAESSTIKASRSNKVRNKHYPALTKQNNSGNVFCLFVCQLEIVPLDLNKPEECNLPKAIGPCKGAVPLFFYNSEKGICESFWYGGCKV